MKLPTFKLSNLRRVCLRPLPADGVFRPPLGAVALLTVATAFGCSDHTASTEVTIQTGAPPALLAFRDEGSTEWQALPIMGAATFDLMTIGAYQVVVACTNDDESPSVKISLYGRTPEDDPLIKNTCTSSVYPFDLRGSMVQPGEIYFGYRGMGTTATNWNFDFPTTAGLFNLVMLSQNSTAELDGIAIRRDVAIAGDKDLGAIDLTKEGLQALVPVSITATNLHPDESAGLGVLLETGNTYALLNSHSSQPSGLAAKLAPNSALQPTDRQRIGLTANATGDPASLQHRVRLLLRDIRAGDPTSMTLPDPLGPVAFETTAERLTATWSPLPEYDEVSLTHGGFSSDSGQSWSYEMMLSRAFIEATGATSATLDFHDIPGFKSEWQHDPTLDPFRTFAVSSNRSTTETTASIVFENLNATNTARTQAEEASNPGAVPVVRWTAPGEPWLRRTLLFPPGSNGQRNLAVSY